MYHKRDAERPVILPNGEKIYPMKGTPQGGILSPLLANIVLNELDWWIASQWEHKPTKTEFKTRCNALGTEIKSHVYCALRRSSLKEMHSVRYADDFKIFCPTHSEAVRAYKAAALWLKDRLGQEINPEKSKVVNLKRQHSESLGFKLKVRNKPFLPRIHEKRSKRLELLRKRSGLQCYWCFKSGFCWIRAP